MDKGKGRQKNYKFVYSRYAYNRGYITLEASLVLPVFLFFLLGMAQIAMLLLAEAHIHQALAEAAGDTAQYCYLAQKLAERKQGSEETGNITETVNTVLLNGQFRNYLGEDVYVERMLLNGRRGIVLTIKADRTNPRLFTVKASYLAVFSLPLFGKITLPLSNEMRQKKFTGYGVEEKEDCYVYITPNQKVYHLKRNCTHLSLSVEERRGEERVGYTPCKFCGRGKRDKIYVARTTNVYHNNRNCLGLKRTVTKVRLHEVNGKGKCSRCGEYR